MVSAIPVSAASGSQPASPVAGSCTSPRTSPANPGVEPARDHLVGLQAEQALVPELVERPCARRRCYRRPPFYLHAYHVRLRTSPFGISLLDQGTKACAKA